MSDYVSKSLNLFVLDSTTIRMKVNKTVQKKIILFFTNYVTLLV